MLGDYTFGPRDIILIGQHTIEQRDEYVNRKALEYLQRHPEAPIRKAKKYARMYWRRKVRGGR